MKDNTTPLEELFFRSHLQVILITWSKETKNFGNQN
jgi:hypothetical protein